MSHDLVIRGGAVVDGTGAEPFAADVAVDGDTIVEIGKVAGKGRQEIQAEGLAVSPGFIDLHTHLDAQIGWDKEVTSISWHGVTTALFGNCGVTFAPCKPADREFLAGMMETVEDIPKNAILHGLPWNWEGYGGYLDALEALGPAINICGLVGHCATRFYVMGERAVEEPASEDEVRQIAELAGQSVKEGAVGFSTNRFPPHRLPDGRSIPGTFADRDELRAVAREVGRHGGIMQTVSDFRDFDAEMDLIRDEARSARGALFSSAAEVGTERMNERVMAMRAEGLDVTSVTVPRSGGGVGGLSTDNFFRTPAWNELRKLDFAGRLKAIRDPATRQRLVREVKGQNQDVQNGMKRWFYMGDAARPCYTQDLSQNLAALAEAAGEHPAETWLRISDETNGKALFPHARLQRQPGRVGGTHQHRVGDAGPRRRRRPRQPDDRLRLVDVHPLALAPRPRPVLDAGGGAAHQLRAGQRAGPRRPRHARGGQAGGHQRLRHQPLGRADAADRARLPVRCATLHPARRRLPRHGVQRHGGAARRRADGRVRRPRTAQRRVAHQARGGGASLGSHRRPL